MQITHAEAHRLIQYDLDRTLDPEKQKSLLAHLQECEDCRGYADGMRDIENQLRQVMNKQWNLSPLPLSIDSIKTRINLPRGAHNLFQLRTALVSMVLVAFSFFIWQLTSTSYHPSEQIPSTILPVPTPSTQLSTASLASPTCEWTLHKVEASDSLESIAFQYSVSKQDIMTFNGMDSELIDESMEIKIPHCNVTPTMTAHWPTRTLTPKLDIFTDTPG